MLAHVKEEDGFSTKTLRGLVWFDGRNEERHSRDGSALQQTKRDTIITAVG